MVMVMVMVVVVCPKRKNMFGLVMVYMQEWYNLKVRPIEWPEDKSTPSPSHVDGDGFGDGNGNQGDGGFVGARDQCSTPLYGS